MSRVLGSRADVAYVVCNRLLDPETDEHCEFDGKVIVDGFGVWKCPSCGGMRVTS
jgi:hypothetical protein